MGYHQLPITPYNPPDPLSTFAKLAQLRHAQQQFLDGKKTGEQDDEQDSKFGRRYPQTGMY